MAFIRQYVELRAKRILDVGCGLGMYVSQFRQFSDDVYGVDIDPDKIARASEWLPNLRWKESKSINITSGTTPETGCGVAPYEERKPHARRCAAWQ